MVNRKILFLNIYNVQTSRLNLNKLDICLFYIPPHLIFVYFIYLPTSFLFILYTSPSHFCLFYIPPHLIFVYFIYLPISFLFILYTSPSHICLFYIPPHLIFVYFIYLLILEVYKINKNEMGRYIE
jgi:hypothetical protein